MSAAAAVQKQRELTPKQLAAVVRLKPSERDPERYGELVERALNDRTKDER